MDVPPDQRRQDGLGHSQDAVTSAKWNAVVAVILALGVATAVVILSTNELTTSGHVSGEESTLLSTVLGTAIGAIAGYLGTHRADTPPAPPEPSQTPQVPSSTE